MAKLPTKRSPSKRGVVRRPGSAQSQRSDVAQIVDAAANAAAAGASGEIRRKNLNVDQGLLDLVRSKLRLKTETEAVEVGLGALLEITDFQAEMLTGFDDLMEAGGILGTTEEEELDFSGFSALPDGSTP